MQTLLVPLTCAALAYRAIADEWRTALHGALIASLSTHEARAAYTLPPWLSPPDRPLAPFPVALAAGGVGYFVTSSFTIVFGAAIDTLFVCMFRDEQSFDGRYSRKHATTQRTFIEVDRARDQSDDQLIL